MLLFTFAANVSGLAFENIGVGYNLLDGSPFETEDPGLLLHRRVLQVVKHVIGFHQHI